MNAIHNNINKSMFKQATGWSHVKLVIPIVVLNKISGFPTVKYAFLPRPAQLN